MLHLLDYFGFTGTGRWYNFWSGFGSDIGEITIAGAIWHTINCHEKGCWRIGHHVNGSIVCHKHRKDDGNTKVIEMGNKMPPLNYSP